MLTLFIIKILSIVTLMLLLWKSYLVLSKKRHSPVLIFAYHVFSVEYSCDRSKLHRSKRPDKFYKLKSKTEAKRTKSWNSRTS